MDPGLRHLRLPVGAVVSILHRLSGVFLVLVFPVALWALGRSLTSPDAYARIGRAVDGLPGRGLLALALVLVAHHVYAGLRHLLLDLDIGASRASARFSAYLVLGLALATGLWIAL